jgi:hypothetical protein
MDNKIYQANNILNAQNIFHAAKIIIVFDILKLLKSIEKRIIIINANIATKNVVRLAQENKK